jgi:3-methyladenine DNA glycosylase/8-oxoguanine DNA glycosylase
MPEQRHVETTLRILPPANFSFRRTVQSHGWYDLPPFAHNAEDHTLDRLLRLEDGTLAACRLSQGSTAIRVRVVSRSRLTAVHRSETVRQMRSCLRLDEDFSAFHAAARRNPATRWIPRSGAGRLLRSPTVFEDVVKMICTTNCTWALTKIMVRRIVERFGDPFGDGRSAFPTPAALAAATERELRRHCTAGYRAPYILELAEKVASGALAIEEWRRSTLPTEELFRMLRTVKGVGPYAAGNVLKLLGRYDYLGLDSWVRQRYAELHARGQKVKDATIERAYARFGRWRGLFFWLEMTR